MGGTYAGPRRAGAGPGRGPGREPGLGGGGGGGRRRPGGGPADRVPQVPAEGAGAPQGPGHSRTPARRRPAPACPRPPCASPPLVSTPMALPAPDIRSFSRSTVAMVAPTRPHSLSRPAPPLSLVPPRALRSAPRRVRSPLSTPGRGRRAPGTWAGELGLDPAVPAFSFKFLNLFSLTRGAFIEGADRGRLGLLVTTCGKAGQAR